MSLYPTPEARQQAVSDLRACADLIEKNGHTKGDFYEEREGVPAAECPVCSVGALYTVTGGQPFGTSGGDWATIQRYIAAKRAFYAHLGESIIDWNDAPERTPEEVITAFRACADRIESGEAPNG